MGRTRPEPRARWLAALVVAVLATMLGGASAFGEDGAGRNSYDYDGGLPNRAPLTAIATNEGADLAVHDRRLPSDELAHVYEDRSNLARRLARLEGYGSAPNTAQAAASRGDDFVEICTDMSMTSSSPISERRGYSGPVQAALASTSRRLRTTRRLGVGG